MRRNVVIATVVILVVVVVGGWWFLLRDNAPPPPDLVTATQVAAAAQLSTTTTAAPTTTTALTTTTIPPTTSSTLEEIEKVDPEDSSGTWSVDTTIGEFGINEASGTFVGFRVEEVLGRGIGSVTAVGRTPLVSGTVEIDGTTLMTAEIVADLTGLRTDRTMRDSRVQDALNTEVHPKATFVLTGPLGLNDGRQVQIPAAGSLTINGVTNAVTVELAAELVGRILTVVGTIDVEFADYNIQAPTAPIVVSVEDNGTVEVQLFLTRQ